MSLHDELESYVQKTLRAAWSTRDGQKVPETDDLTLSNSAVKLAGTVLYADLAGSTELVGRYYDWFSAEVYKSYLYCAAKLIRSNGGVITAYDGDRVMGVFIGDNKNSAAAKCALQTNWAVNNLINPGLEERYPKSTYRVAQRVGIDTSNLFVARTGVRGSNDLVWVGNAANIAAKLAALPTNYKSYITADVYDELSENCKLSNENPKRHMWVKLNSNFGLGRQVYGSTYQWSV